jgi:hypothetical protein
MTFIKTLSKFIAVAVLLIIASIKIAYADGFPLRPGRLIISPSFSYFFANTRWDSVGHKEAFPKNGHFSSLSYSLYVEYGISRRFTLVASLPYVINKYQQSDYSSLNSGASDLETGLRYYLGNIAYKYYFSIQGTVITPLYTNPNLGYGLTGAELKLSFAGSGHLFGNNSFYVLENGVRQYFGSAGPLQDRYSGTFGVSLDKKFQNQISATISGVYSTSNNNQFNLLNPINNKNFAFNQASLSYGHTFDKNFSMFLTGGHFITGRNTGDGLTASASMIYRIDYK